MIWIRRGLLVLLWTVRGVGLLTLSFNEQKKKGSWRNRKSKEKKRERETNRLTRIDRIPVFRNKVERKLGGSNSIISIKLMLMCVVTCCSVYSYVLLACERVRTSSAPAFLSCDWLIVEHRKRYVSAWLSEILCNLQYKLIDDTIHSPSELTHYNRSA